MFAVHPVLQDAIGGMQTWAERVKQGFVAHCNQSAQQAVEASKSEIEMAVQAALTKMDDGATAQNAQLTELTSAAADGVRSHARAARTAFAADVKKAVKVIVRTLYEAEDNAVTSIDKAAAETCARVASDIEGRAASATQRADARLKEAEKCIDRAVGRVESVAAKARAKVASDMDGIAASAAQRIDACLKEATKALDEDAAAKLAEGSRVIEETLQNVQMSMAATTVQNCTELNKFVQNLQTELFNADAFDIVVENAVKRHMKKASVWLVPTIKGAVQQELREQRQRLDAVTVVDNAEEDIYNLTGLTLTSTIEDLSAKLYDQYADRYGPDHEIGLVYIRVVSNTIVHVDEPQTTTLADAGFGKNDDIKITVYVRIERFY